MHEIGKLVQRLRKQRGLTQADLAEQTNIDTATLSKIENGHAMPKQNTIKNLLEKLRFDPGGVIPLFLSEKDARFEKLKAKLPGIGDPRDHEQTKKMNDFIAEFEKDTELYEDDLNRQYIKTVQGVVLIRPANVVVTESWGRAGLSREELIKERESFVFPKDIAEKLDKAIEVLYEGMYITIPAFEIAKMDEYYLSAAETNIVRNLANAYYFKGNEDLAIDIYKKLEKSIDSNYKGKATVGDSYLSTIANLCNLLIYAYRFEEALEYSNKGLDECIELQLAMLPLLAQFKGAAMLEIINKEKGAYDVPEATEAKEILKDAYYGARLAKRISVQKNVESLFAKLFKTKVDGTPLEDVQ